MLNGPDTELKDCVGANINSVGRLVVLEEF
jgi:hypothetical protein